MKVTLETAALRRVASVAEKVAAGANASLPVTRGVELETTVNSRGAATLTVRSTDLNRQCRLRVSAATGADAVAGQVIPNSHDFAKLVSSLGGDRTTLSTQGTGTEDRVLVVESGKTRAQVPVYPDELPWGDEPVCQASFDVESPWLRSCLQTAFHCLSEQEGHPTSCAHLEITHEGRVRVVGTDGVRMSFREETLEFGSYEVEGAVVSALLPDTMLRTMLDLLPQEPEPLTVGVGETRAVFRWGDGEVQVILMGGKYPNVDKLLAKVPKLSSACTVMTRDLQATLRRVLIAAEKNERQHATWIYTTPTGLRLGSQSMEVGRVVDEVSGKRAGDDARGVYSGALLREALQSLGRESITVRMGDEDTPLMLEFTPREWVLLMRMDWRGGLDDDD